LTHIRTGADLAISRSAVHLSPDQVNLALLALALAVGTALRLWAAFTNYAVFHPDEVHQSLEPAHRLVFGYGYQSWEYAQGARNWTFAGLLAGLMGLTALVHLDVPWVYLGLIRVVLCGASMATAAGAYRLARELAAGRTAAACAASVVALSVVLIYFAPRAFSDSAAVLPVAVGLATALPSASHRRHLWLGASLLGLATLIRLQSGIFCAGLIVVLACQRRWRATLEASIVLLSWAGLYGLIDWLTWGGWFHSAITYVAFNLRSSSSFGTAPLTYYFTTIWTAIGPLALLVGLLAVVGASRAKGLAAMVFGYGLLHCLLPHKELRFILPILPLLAVLAALGLQTVLDLRPSPVFAAALPASIVVVALISATGLGQLTREQLGDGHERPLNDGDAVNRLLLVASWQPDLCGLLLGNGSPTFTGGYTYLHRRVPIYTRQARGSDASRTNRFNYAINDLEKSDGTVVAIVDSLALTRLPIDHCEGRFNDSPAV
jgi:hypothetical protein